MSKESKRQSDKELTEELKQSFPASDPPTVTRQPAHKGHVESEAAEKKKDKGKDQDKDKDKAKP